MQNLLLFPYPERTYQTTDFEVSWEGQAVRTEHAGREWHIRMFPSGYEYRILYYPSGELELYRPTMVKRDGRLVRRSPGPNKRGEPEESEGWEPVDDPVLLELAAKWVVALAQRENLL